jgi:predicted esterase
MLQTIEKETGANPSVSIIWMHGLGADANDFVPMLHELTWPACPRSASSSPTPTPCRSPSTAAT